MTQFNPSEHITNLPQGKDKTGKDKTAEYLEVKWRLCWFRDQCSEGTIHTELVTLDLDRAITAEVYVWNEQTRRKEKVQKTANGWCLFKATITDGKGGIASAHGSESAVDFGDYIEKAETKAVGRALAYLGYGTQFAPELNEGERIVDAPVTKAGGPEEDTSDRLAQVKTLFQTLYKPEKWEPFKVRHIGMPVSDKGLSLKELDKLMSALTEAREQAKHAKAS